METASIQNLEREIERLVGEHMVAHEIAVVAAVQRAFAAARQASHQPAQKHKTAKAKPRKITSQRRSTQQISELAERLYMVVCENPGESMKSLTSVIGGKASEWSKPMAALKKAGKVRSVGERQYTRYFPMATSEDS